MPKSKYKPWGKRKFNRCIRKVISNSPEVNPYAVCTDNLNKTKKKRKKK